MPEVIVSQAGEVERQDLPGTEARIRTEAKGWQGVEGDICRILSFTAVGSDGDGVGSGLADGQRGLRGAVLPQVGGGLSDVSVEGGGLAFAEGLAATEVDWRGLYYFN